MIFQGMMPGDPGECVESFGVRVREAGVPVVRGDLEADGCGGHVDSGADARDRQAVFDAGGGCIYDLGARTVVTGRVERGVVKVGDEVEIIGIRPTVKTVCTGVEMFRKILDQGQAGDNIGVLLRGIKREEVERGQVVAKPGSITPHRKFKAETYILTKEEGVGTRLFSMGIGLSFTFGRRM